jgi:hypothetical protein
MRSFAAILFFTWLLNLFLPWWSALLPAVIIGMWLLESSLRAFLIGLTAGGLAWIIQALYVHIANDGILTGRIAEVLQVGSPVIVLLLTFLAGGLISGFGTLFGYQLRRSVLHERNRSTHS